MKTLKVILIFITTTTLSYAQDTISNSFAVAPTKNNYLYIGIENPLSISVSEFSDKDLIVKTTNGIINGGNGEYKVTPLSGNKLEIFVYVKCKTDTCFVGTSQFRLKKIPDPDVFLGWCKDKTSVHKGELLAGVGLVTSVGDFIYDLKFPIKSFELKTIKDKKEIILKSSSAAYTKEMQELISESKSGTELIFQNIIVIYPDKTERLLEKTITTKLL
jgi:GldM C-terminal domain